MSLRAIKLKRVRFLVSILFGVLTTSLLSIGFTKWLLDFSDKESAYKWVVLAFAAPCFLIVLAIMIEDLNDNVKRVMRVSKRITQKKQKAAHHG